MLLPLKVATYASKIRHKGKASTLAAFVGHRVVFIMKVFALARGFPLMDVKPFPPWKPIHANLFWSARDEGESLAWTLTT